MKVKTFEAYKHGYRGMGLNSNRKEFIEEFWTMFDDQHILGYEITGTAFHPNKQIITLFLDKKGNGQYSNEDYSIQLDISDLGIEIGKIKWIDPDNGDFEFIPITNLDTPEIKAAKDYKQTIKKFNL